MIHTTPDFFNKVAIEIRSTYFPDEIHGITENKDYHKTTRTLELFNNGCINYRQLIGRVAKSCNDTTSKINSVIEKHIVSFGSYQYKPCK